MLRGNLLRYFIRFIRFIKIVPGSVEKEEDSTIKVLILTKEVY